MKSSLRKPENANREARECDATRLGTERDYEEERSY
jgi:hypothetical protein